ncbi:MAG: UPF0755 protein, partial [Candidatus Krumholzibacteriia bacterium]
MKRILIVVALGVLAGLVTLAWGWDQWTGAGPVSGSGESTTLVRIAPGTTLSAAADSLVNRGLLREAQALVIGARLTRQDRGLKAGLYEVAFGQSPRELLSNLTSGQAVQLVLTIPEGLDCDEIAALVGKVFPFSAATFLAQADAMARKMVVEGEIMSGAEAVAAHDQVLEANSSRVLHWAEGLLAPDTYYFAEGSSSEQVTRVLLETQFERLGRAVNMAASGPNAALSPFALLTFASIVESEARVDEERTKIAAVYANRLQKGWRLEADPTVAFVLNKKGDRLFFKHLKVESPYNTYLRRGLPAGPIGTPGMASLLAAAKPDQQ